MLQTRFSFSCHLDFSLFRSLVVPDPLHYLTSSSVITGEAYEGVGQEARGAINGKHPKRYTKATEAYYTAHGTYISQFTDGEVGTRN